jgi:hypothetical protein
MGPARQACKGGTVSVGRRLLGELFRDNGIHHADSCKSRHPFLGPVSGTTSRIDAYESPAGEVIYTCTECRRLAIWKDRVLQPDPIWELEHARVRGPGEQERADAAAELERLQRPNLDIAVPSGPVEPSRPRRPGRPRGSGLEIPNVDVVLDEFRRLKAAKPGGQPTKADLAKKMGVPPSTLRDALTRFRLGWPPE